jgi:hypothetical protein
MSRPYPQEVTSGVVSFDVYAIPGVRELIEDHLKRQWEDHADPEKDLMAKRVTTIKVTSQVEKDGDAETPFVDVSVSQKLAPASKSAFVKIVDTEVGKDAQLRLF